MHSLLPTREPPLKRYFVAASVEEALAYLSAHRGEAQVVGGGTTLLPIVLAARSVARYLVDISRIASLRRIRAERDHLLLGGAVTLAQILRSETALSAQPVLGEMASAALTPRLRELATLGGEIVRASGNSSVSSTMIALDAEAEVANLTGSQWVPVRSLLVRPGTCRVNSMSEVLATLRIPIARPGLGAALVRTEASGNGMEDATTVAAVVGFDGAQDLVSWLSLVVGRPGATPLLCRLSDLSEVRPPAVDSVRRAVQLWAMAQSGGIPSEENTARARLLASAAQRALNAALERARFSLSNGML